MHRTARSIPCTRNIPSARRTYIPILHKTAKQPRGALEISRQRQKNARSGYVEQLGARKTSLGWRVRGARRGARPLSTFHFLSRRDSGSAGIPGFPGARRIPIDPPDVGLVSRSDFFRPRPRDGARKELSPSPNRSIQAGLWEFSRRRCARGSSRLSLKNAALGVRCRAPFCARREDWGWAKFSGRFAAGFVL